MNPITLPIGFRFVLDNEVYEVVKDEAFFCKGCAFLNKQCNLLVPSDIPCHSRARTDDNNVIFKKIGYIVIQPDPATL